MACVRCTLAHANWHSRADEQQQLKKMQFNLIWNHGHMSPHAGFEYRAPFVCHVIVILANISHFRFRFHIYPPRCSPIHFFLFLLLSYNNLQTLVRYGRFLWHIFFGSRIFVFSATRDCKCDSNHRETSILTQRIGNSVRFKFVPSPTLELFHCNRKQFAWHVIFFRICSWLNFIRGEKRVPGNAICCIALFHTLSYVCHCVHSPKWNEKSTKFFK